MRRRSAEQALHVFCAFLAASGILAVAEAARIAVFLPLPAVGWGLRLAHLAFATSETLGVGATAGLLAAALARWSRAPTWALLAVGALVAACAIEPAIGENLTRIASVTFDGRLESALAATYRALVAGVLPGVAYVAARCSSRAPWRLAFVSLALAILAVHPWAFTPDDYEGAHGVLSCGAALMGGAALAHPLESTLRAVAWRRRGGALLALCAALGVALPPPNNVRCELFRLPGAVAPWALVKTWPVPEPHARIAPPDSPWFADRSAEPPATPSARLLPDDAVVVLITIDGVRADVVLDPASDARLTALAEMKRDGVVFTQARSPGSQTALALSAVFSGRTFSEQIWTDHGHGSARFDYPAADPSTRFPELLTRHGVTTANFASIVFLSDDFGVVRGFTEEQVLAKGNHHAYGKKVIDALLRFLGAEPAHPGPTFLYAHLMDAHAPYGRSIPGESARERYLGAIGDADVAIARVIRRLKERFGDRWVLIVSSDHGEAFGEHQTTGHAKTLYEELLRVPLVVYGPRLTPGRVQVPVTLVDLGPTILDLFGVATPSSFVGQTLVPYLAGGSATLQRPIFAEGRLRRALAMPDGLKVIEDTRRKTVEVYDLSADPAEARNLFDAAPARSDAALVALRTFFARHTRTAGGYRPPFKP